MDTLGEKNTALEGQLVALPASQRSTVSGEYAVDQGLGSQFDALPDAIAVAVVRFTVSEGVGATCLRLRCASRGCCEAVQAATNNSNNPSSCVSSRWGTSMVTISRRILRTGRSFSCWVALELVAFPLLIMARSLGVPVPMWVVFLPVWAALLVAIRTTWNSLRFRRAVTAAMEFQASVGRRRPLLRIDMNAVRDSRTLNVLHLASSLPMPLVHLAVLGQWFELGCVLSLVPSLVISIVSTWLLLRHRCECRPLCCMLSSIALIAEWCFFPACLLPRTTGLPLFLALFWLLPVTMPYVLLFCHACAARLHHLALVVALIYSSVLLLHGAFFGAGPPTATLSCACLGTSGCVLARHVWRVADRRGFVGHEELQSVFVFVANLLE